MASSPLPTCPKCGAVIEGATETCNSCGVIFSKLRSQSVRSQPALADYSGSTEQLYSGAPAVATRVRCQSCGGPGPTANAVFRQNIGALIMRFSRKVEGDLCGPCVRKYFTQYTLVTTAVGWFGYISVFVAPVFVVLNIVNVVQATSSLSAAKRNPLQSGVS